MTKTISVFLLTWKLFMSTFAANLEEAYEPPLSIGRKVASSPDKQPLIVEKTLKAEIFGLDLVMLVRRIDPFILCEEESQNIPRFDLMPPGDYLFGSTLKQLYSEDPQQRNQAFALGIKKPILNAIKKAAEFSLSFSDTSSSYKFLKPLSYLEPYCEKQNEALLDVAIKNIFTHHPETLAELKNVLETLNRHENITSEQKRSLFLFRNLGGYFFDRKALEYLVKNNRELLTSFSSPIDFGDPHVRCGILRILQVEGEFVKMMLPSTLRSGENFPTIKLQELRTQLSHPNSRKLAIIFDTTSTEIFSHLHQDIGQLNIIFESMVKHYPSMDTFGGDPVKLWEHLTSLPEEESAKPGQVWKGLEEFLTLLTYNRDEIFSRKAPFTSDDVAFVYPFPPESSAHVEDIKLLHERHLAIQRFLGCKYKDFKSFNVFFEGLKEFGDIEEQTCRGFFEYGIQFEREKQDVYKPAKEFSQQIDNVIDEYFATIPAIGRKYPFDKNLLLKCKDFDKALKQAQKTVPDLDRDKFKEAVDRVNELKRVQEIKNKECKQHADQIDKTLEELKTKIICSLLQVDSSSLGENERKFSLLYQVEQRRMRLVEDLKEVKTTYGHKNFTKACKELATRLHVPLFLHDWLITPETPLERLFHKVHQTKITTLFDKNRHRHERLHEIIKFINILRNFLKIETDARLEIEREVFTVFVGEKHQRMRSLQIEKYQPHLQRIAQQFEEFQRDHADFVSQNNRSVMSFQNMLQAQNVNYQALITIQDKFLDLKVIERREGLTLVELSSSYEQARSMISNFLSTLEEAFLLAKPEFLAFRKGLANVARSHKMQGLLRIEGERRYLDERSLRMNECRTVSGMLKERIQRNMLSYEFLVASFYELLKEINDYPELKFLEGTKGIRNFFFHTDPFELKTLDISHDVQIHHNRADRLVREISLLCVNVKFLLENISEKLFIPLWLREEDEKLIELWLDLCRW